MANPAYNATQTAQTIAAAAKTIRGLEQAGIGPPVPRPKTTSKTKAKTPPQTGTPNAVVPNWGAVDQAMIAQFGRTGRY